MMKFFVESQDSSNRWQFELDVDTAALEELLESDEWLHEGPYSEYTDIGDFTQHGSGYLVYGIEDKEMETLVARFKVWFEEQEIDADEITTTAHTDEEYLHEEDDYTADIFDDMFSAEDY